MIPMELSEALETYRKVKAIGPAEMMIMGRGAEADHVEFAYSALAVLGDALMEQIDIGEQMTELMNEQTALIQSALERHRADVEMETDVCDCTADVGSELYRGPHRHLLSPRDGNQLTIEDFDGGAGDQAETTTATGTDGGATIEGVGNLTSSFSGSSWCPHCYRSKFGPDACRCPGSGLLAGSGGTLDLGLPTDSTVMSRNDFAIIPEEFTGLTHGPPPPDAGLTMAVHWTGPSSVYWDNVETINHELAQEVSRAFSPTQQAASEARHPSNYVETTGSDTDPGKIEGIES